MINVSFGPNIFLGIIVSVGVLILYSLRNVKPEIARDEDIFFSTMGFLYSIILMVHGWRLDPILSPLCRSLGHTHVVECCLVPEVWSLPTNPALPLYCLKSKANKLRPFILLYWRHKLPSEKLRH